MADTIQLEIATPDRLLVREQVSEVEVPGANGAMGILPGHAPLLSELGIGELSYVAHGHRRFLTISGGFVQVSQDHVRVLATSAEKADEIDVKAAEEALKRAEELLNKAPEGLDVARAINSMKRAQSRLQCARDAGTMK
jgi:F-type H+-transporting ATPase subunit epsilon